MELWNVTQQTQLASRLRIAVTFLQRLKGLLGTKFLPEGEALLIRPCSSVHTLGMNYAIDVLFMTADDRVLKIAASMPPGRAAVAWGSSYVLELPPGIAAKTGTVVGDQLFIKKHE
ncbi:MAG: hypothetical protein H6Q65_431 [Firmicutes bacterium]|nr:hypothetical protein [Bacillota bacterium]